MSETLHHAPKWTSAQKQAINYRGGDVLVTAGAGSGKTAVLAARCISLLTDPQNPCSLDELLVLTFTNAAAGEMRRRIGLELRRLPPELQDRQRHQRQIALLDQADICTLHAFCANLVREHFYHLDIDPSFEMMDDVETDLLQLQTAEEVFADAYDNGLPDVPQQTFADLLDGYGRAGDDRSVITIILQLQRFLETLSDAHLWRQAWRDHKNHIQAGDITRLSLMQLRRRQLLQINNQHIHQLQQALASLERFSPLNDYAAKVRTGLLAHLETMRDALQAPTCNFDIFCDPPRSPALTKKHTQTLHPDDYEPAKNTVQQIRKDCVDLQKRYGANAAQILQQARLTAPLADAVLALHDRFADRYQRYKQKRRVLDFSDLEHLAVRLLQDSSGPTDIARNLQRRYRHVLIDEYQDISPVQEQLLSCLARPNPQANRFMVGDIKQSIYGFRRADPTIFLDKLNAYLPMPADVDSALACSDGARVDLNDNFRSRRQVINGVNAIFNRCMTADFCGVDYTAAPLLYGADYPPAANESAYRMELHLIERQTASPQAAEENTDNDNSETPESDLNELDVTQREAAVIARRIRRMVGADQPGHQAEFTLRDGHTGRQRPVRYRDIVILLRSMKKRAEIFAEVFTRLGVPVHAELSSGYFVATEIQDMLNLLRLLDNPRQDIPIAAVLRCPLVGLDDNALAHIRLHTPRGAYYQAILLYTQSGPDESLRLRLKQFLNQLDAWRTCARQTSLARIIWTIYRQTDYPAIVSGLPGGPQRYQNLLALHDRARQFDSFSRQGIARFLSFIEKLRDEEGDFGPAPVLTEADDVVRIMSVHKSKGLEFPVVIVAGLAKQFNLSDARRPILFDRPDHGVLGMQLIEPVTHNRWPTLAHRLLADHNAQKTQAEELRLLYVALTRAREKLILSATVDLNQARNNWPNDASAAGALPTHLLQQARCWADWVGPALANHDDMQAFFNPADHVHTLFDLHVHESSELLALGRDMDAHQRPGRSFTDTDAIIDTLPDTPLTNESSSLLAKISRRYPHLTATHLPSRCSVTELKRLSPIHDETDLADSPADRIAAAPLAAYAFQARPLFLQTQPATLTPAEIGSVTHLALQHLALDGPLDESNITRQVASLVTRNLLTPVQAQSIDIPSLAALFASPLGRELREHRDSLRREWPFALTLSAGELLLHEQLNPTEHNDLILIRGVIDAFYQTYDGAVIVDFKTDNITPAQATARSEQYRLQLGLYRRAIETILSLPVRRQMLYFLTPRLAVEIAS